MCWTNSWNGTVRNPLDAQLLADPFRYRQGNADPKLIEMANVADIDKIYVKKRGD